MDELLARLDNICFKLDGIKEKADRILEKKLEAQKAQSKPQSKELLDKLNEASEKKMQDNLNTKSETKHRRLKDKITSLVLKLCKRKSKINQSSMGSIKGTTTSGPEALNAELKKLTARNKQLVDTINIITQKLENAISNTALHEIIAPKSKKGDNDEQYDIYRKNKAQEVLESLKTVLDLLNSK